MALVVAPDPVARGEPPDGRPDGLDDPGHVPPHDEGEEQVLRQLATANQGVHRIDANRGGLDEHVRRADRGDGPFAELDVLRRADAVDVGSFHGSNPLRPKEPEALREYPLQRPPLVPPSADDPAQQRRPPGDIVRRTTSAVPVCSCGQLQRLSTPSRHTNVHSFFSWAIRLLRVSVPSPAVCRTNGTLVPPGATPEVGR